MSLYDDWKCTNDDDQEPLDFDYGFGRAYEIIFLQVPHGTSEAFERACHRHGQSPNEVLRNFIELTIDLEPQVEEDEKQAKLPF